MIYATDTQAYELVWFDRTGRELQAKALSRVRGQSVRLSPDGKAIAFARRELDGSINLWRMDVSQAIPTRVTHNDANDDFPIWSPDAEFLVFRSSRAGTFDIYRKRSGGAGDAELLLASEGNLRPTDWSPDGRYVAYTNFQEPGIWMLPMEGKQEASFALAASAFREEKPTFSPNGKFVAYQSDETGRYEIYVQSFPSTGRKWPVSSSGGGGPRWSPDGREILYINAARELVSTRVETDAAEIRIRESRVLFLTNVRTSLGDSSFDISADGERFVFGRPLRASSPLTVLLNWEEALRNSASSTPFYSCRWKRLDADIVRYR